MLESEKEPFSWGFEAGFLRSPVNPRMLLLNRTPEIDCAGDGSTSGNASAWSLVSIANDLLRVDLSSLFNEIGNHFRERAELRFYIDLQNAIRQPPAAPHHVQHTSIDSASEPDHDDWLDPDDPDQEPTQAELNEAEIAINLQKQKERDLDFFAPIFDEAITSHAHGEISGMARYLLENVCRQCVMNITAIPDYRYYSCWMYNNAIECDEINRLYRAVITTSGQLNKQEMASLFSSYLQLESNDMSINATNGETDLTAPVPYDRDNPIRNFPKAKSQIETACVCTNIDLFRALLIVFYQECLELTPLLKNTEAPSLLAQNEEFFPAAIKTSDPRQFRLFDEQLPAIIRFGEAFVYEAKKHLPGNETAQKLEEHLNGIKRMNSAPFMQAFCKTISKLCARTRSSQMETSIRMQSLTTRKTSIGSLGFKPLFQRQESSTSPKRNGPLQAFMPASFTSCCCAALCRYHAKPAVRSFFRPVLTASTAIDITRQPSSTATRDITPKNILVANRPAMSRSICRERPKRHMKRA